MPVATNKKINVLNTKQRKVFWVLWFAVTLVFTFLLEHLWHVAAINIAEFCRNSGLVIFCGVDVVMARDYLWLFLLINCLSIVFIHKNRSLWAFLMLCLLILASIFILGVYNLATFYFSPFAPIFFSLFCLILYLQKHQKNFFYGGIVIWLALFIVFYPKAGEWQSSGFDHIDYKVSPNKVYYFQEQQSCECLGIKGRAYDDMGSYSTEDKKTLITKCYGIVRTCSLHERTIYEKLGAPKPGSSDLSATEDEATGVGFTGTKDMNVCAGNSELCYTRQVEFLDGEVIRIYFPDGKIVEADYSSCEDNYCYVEDESGEEWDLVE